MFIKDNILTHLNLQLFGEGGAGDGGTGAAGTTGETGVAAVPQTKGVKNNPLANVVYGKQAVEAQAADVQTKITDADGNTVETVDRNAEFEKLIKGEYKDLYESRMQDTIQKRLKSTKEKVDKFDSLSPMFEMLSKKYGVDATDTSAIMKAIEEDDSYYEQEALEKGVSVEELKEVKRMERENKELKRQLDEQEGEKRRAQIYADWLNQSKELKTIYPTFDLDSELDNPEFVQYLRIPGVDVRKAYELTHKDDIIAGAMQFTAQTVERKLANKIMANGVRPVENGMNSQGAAVVKSDVSQLSKADRQEIIRRVQRGEKISF